MRDISIAMFLAKLEKETAERFDKNHQDVTAVYSRENENSTNIKITIND